MICLERGYTTTGELPEFCTAACQARAGAVSPTINKMETDTPPTTVTPTRAHSAPAHPKSSQQQKSWLTKFKFSGKDSKASSDRNKTARRSAYFSNNSDEKRTSGAKGDSLSGRPARVGASVCVALVEISDMHSFSTDTHTRSLWRRTSPRVLTAEWRPRHTVLAMLVMQCAHISLCLPHSQGQQHSVLRQSASEGCLHRFYVAARLCVSNALSRREGIVSTVAIASAAARCPPLRRLLRFVRCFPCVCVRVRVWVWLS